MDVVFTTLTYIIPVFVVAFVLYIIRALKGPTISDQVLAIDAMTYDVAAFLVILAIYLRIPILVATAIVLALWIYAFDIYIAKYLEKREMGE
ncbi:MAG: monovalent cation/H+ antiporter complex subunit F [Thermoprotei archaeon]